DLCHSSCPPPSLIQARPSSFPASQISISSGKPSTFVTRHRPRSTHFITILPGPEITKPLHWNAKIPPLPLMIPPTGLPINQRPKAHRPGKTAPMVKILPRQKLYLPKLTLPEPLNFILMSLSPPRMSCSFPSTVRHCRSSPSLLPTE